MNKSESQYIGRFRIGNRQLPGLVTLKGAASRLELYSDSLIHVPDERKRTIRGTARTGKKITICDAIGDSEGSQHYHGTEKHFASMFPHFVAVGPRHLDTDKKVISEIIFTTSEANTLFYDRRAFGSINRSSASIKRLLPSWAKSDRRKIQFSKAFYYIGRGSIISVSTKAIAFDIFNGVSWRSPSPKQGISLTNTVRITLKFLKPVALKDATRSAFDFRIFCEFISQTKHTIDNIQIKHKASTPREGLISLRMPRKLPLIPRLTSARTSSLLTAAKKRSRSFLSSGWKRKNPIAMPGGEFPKVFEKTFTRSIDSSGQRTHSTYSPLKFTNQKGFRAQ
jgi:ApeA N-terminal domain 1